MADEVEMTPVAGAEPPKANPLAKPAMTKVETIKLNPIVRKPMPGAAPSPALKPGLKLPPKPGLAAGLKLPPKPGAATAALKPGLKLPTQTALKPGLKLPTQTALKPGVKLPPKPVIRKPGATVAAAPLPKPVAPVAAEARAAHTAVTDRERLRFPRIAGLHRQRVRRAVPRGRIAQLVLSAPAEVPARRLAGATRTAAFEAVLHPAGSAVVAGGQDVVRLLDPRTDVTARAVAALRHDMGDLHEVLVPARTRIFTGLGH